MTNSKYPRECPVFADTDGELCEVIDIYDDGDPPFSTVDPYDWVVVRHLSCRTCERGQYVDELIDNLVPLTQTARGIVALLKNKP